MNSERTSRGKRPEHMFHAHFFIEINRRNSACCIMNRSPSSYSFFFFSLSLRSSHSLTSSTKANHLLPRQNCTGLQSSSSSFVPSSHHLMEGFFPRLSEHDDDFKRQQWTEEKCSLRALNKTYSSKETSSYFRRNQKM